MGVQSCLFRYKPRLNRNEVINLKPLPDFKKTFHLFKYLFFLQILLYSPGAVGDVYAQNNVETARLARSFLEQICEDIPSPPEESGSRLRIPEIANEWTPPMEARLSKDEHTTIRISADFGRIVCLAVVAPSDLKAGDEIPVMFGTEAEEVIRPRGTASAALLFGGRGIITATSGLLEITSADEAGLAGSLRFKGSGYNENDLSPAPEPLHVEASFHATPGLAIPETVRVHVRPPASEEQAGKSDLQAAPEVKAAREMMAKEAFDDYRDCRRQIAAAKTAEELQRLSCLGSEHQMATASPEEMEIFFELTRQSSPENPVLAGFAPPGEDAENDLNGDTIRLWIRGGLGSELAAIRAEMQLEEGAWHIVSEDITIETDVIQTPEGAASPEFQVTIDGRPVLNSDNAVLIATDDFGFPRFVVKPLFDDDAPTLVMFNFRPDSRSQQVTKRSLEEIRENPESVSVNVEDEEIPESAGIEGELIVSGVRDARVSGSSRLNVSYFMLDRPIEIVFDFENVPLPTEE